MRTERVAFAVCGSFCTHAKALNALSRLAEEYEMLIPIASENAAFTDTRFGAADALLEQMEAITGREVLYDIPSVEPLGPKGLADVLVIVNDGASEEIMQQHDTVLQVLSDLGATEQPRIEVINKCDLYTDEAGAPMLIPGAVRLSAKTGEGVDEWCAWLREQADTWNAR